MSERAEVVPFCPGCFASSYDGSWGHICDESHCFNCGAGPTVMLPRWAVESIRRQASWVGKRYYPHEEDIAAQKEVAALRAFAPPDPTDTVEECGEGQFSVWRRSADGTRIGLVSVAGTKADALAAARLRLRYVPENHESGTE
jgi:hypothetical protein